MTARPTIAVIGGGSAGFTAARTAANQGARVIFFMGDNAAMASLCVNRGCMPSKALFEPIDALHHARRQGYVRAEPIRPEDHLSRIVAWKDREIARFRSYRQHAIRQHESADFEVIRSNARFIDRHTVASESHSYRFDAAVLATGSTPAVPLVDGLDELRDEVWTNDDILANTRLPDSLVVIGAGAIGLELGYATPERIRRDVEGWFVVETQGPDGFEPIVGQRVLLAVGRRPNLAGLGMQALGIELGGGRRLDVGDDMRIAGFDHIFAAGDVIGQRMVVHQAHIEAGIAAENAATEGQRRWSRLSNLQVLFSDPEFAYAGITAEKGERQELSMVSTSKESRLVGKLHLAGDDMGFGEMIADADDHRLLGCGLLCQDASNMIHLPAYLIDHGHTVHDGAGAEYYHPTKIEIVSGMFDALCRRLGGHPFKRADEKTG